MSEFDWIVCSDETATKEFVCITLEHAFEVNKILLGQLLLLLLLLLAVLHEIKHFVIRVFLYVLLEVHDCLVLG
jgi:hypothetical protein